VAIAAIVALAVPASAGALGYADENALSCASDQNARDTFIYDPGECKFMQRSDVLQHSLRSYYEAKGFDGNFLTWAPIRQIDPTGRSWTYCPTSHFSIPCPVTPLVDEVRDTVVNGPLTTIEWSGAFIALVCGNYSGKAKGPMPRITGVKYEDMNGNGTRDAGEPGRGGWTIRLRYGGAHVATTTTAANGAYSFSLNANSLPIGPGQFTVEEVQKSGWVASEAPAPINVAGGVGDHTFGGNDFGNYRPAVISGAKFDDSDVSGTRDSGELGLPGWTIGLSNGDTSATDAAGAYSFSVRPGNYTVKETQQQGWRQTTPGMPGTHTFTVQSGDVVKNADFGNVCLGGVDVHPIDDSSGDPLAGLEVRLEEVAVGGVLDNDPPLPRTTTGAPSFDDLLPGTYRVTVFLPDGVYTADEDVTLVDERFAVVKEVTVEECERTDLDVHLFTRGTPGKVTGGVKVPVTDGFVTGGFVFMAPGGDARGTLEHVDHKTGSNLHTRAIEAIDVSGGTAVVWGTVDVGGVDERFVLRLVDAGEPGTDDRYELIVGDGYRAGQEELLLGGNVQIHR
jgi:hypothetical protein